VPPSSLSAGAGSSVWWMAHQQIHSSATMGIFRITIRYTNVHSTAA
jgi:hypothetical protein